MVKNTHKLKRDAPLALDILSKIHNSYYHSILLQHYPIETYRLSQKLKKLGSSNNGNHISSIIAVLKIHAHQCQNYGKMAPIDRDAMTTFITALNNYLQELDDNIHEFDIQINCALDAYTLHRTTALISFLRTFIYEQELKMNIKANLLAHSNDVGIKKSTAFYETKSQPQTLQKELSIANALKTLCEEIRAQIGSPETMPKGLMINFIVQLLDAIRGCQQLYPQADLSPGTLLDCIKKEINVIKESYPELAQAGEDLQKAIANYQIQKS